MFVVTAVSDSGPVPVLWPTTEDTKSYFRNFFRQLLINWLVTSYVINDTVLIAEVTERRVGYVRLR